MGGGGGGSEGKLPKVSMVQICGLKNNLRLLLYRLYTSHQRETPFTCYSETKTNGNILLSILLPFI